MHEMEHHAKAMSVSLATSCASADLAAHYKMHMHCVLWLFEYILHACSRWS
jgi:hypothetical protein